MMLIKLAIISTIIILSDQQIIEKYFENYYMHPTSDYTNRNAIKLNDFKWPNGIVPYLFNDNLLENDRKLVINAMEIFTNKTCIKFVPKLDQHIEHIIFKKSNSCGSSIGYRPNRTEPLEVTYSAYCLKLPGAIQHELLHVFGLFHEQSRPDRDDYITVLWDNIEPKYYQNFVKMSEKNVETFGLPYDYNSLLHYPRNAFAKSNANVTMVCKNNFDMELGQYNGPTFYDLEKVRLMYACKLMST